MADQVTPAPAAQGAVDEREKSKQIGALSALWPYMLPYRLLMLAAIFALVLTAMISLTLPLAVRRVIDNFSTADGAILDQYFLAAIGIAALLAVGTSILCSY